MTEPGTTPASVSFAPPDADEIEVTLFGRGNGECCVVHVGSGQWLIVDSFSTGRGRAALPVARWYLDRLQFGRDAVFAIVVTHFDVDHYRGLSALHDYYREAQLCYPAALREPNFRAIGAGGAASKATLGDWPEVFERAVKRTLAGRAGYAGLHTRTDVDAPDGVRIMALSPTDEAIVAANLDLGQRLDNIADIKHYLRQENNCSVVLHISCRDAAILLGGDLLREPPEFGWETVINHQRHKDLPRHAVIKVAHHGSESSHYEPFWDRWVEAEPVLLVAPYRSEGLPRPTDVQRLLGYGGSLWQAAPSEVEPQLQARQKIAKHAPGEVGFVRARLRPGSAWVIDIGPPAFQVLPNAQGA